MESSDDPPIPSRLLPVTPITPTARTAPDLAEAQNGAKGPPVTSSGHALVPISPISPITPTSLNFCSDSFATAFEVSPVDLSAPYDFNFDGLFGLPNDFSAGSMPLPADTSELPSGLMVMPNESSGIQPISTGIQPNMGAGMEPIHMATQTNINNEAQIAWQSSNMEAMQESVEMAARFPPEMIPTNYTTAIEADLSVPLTFSEASEDEQGGDNEPAEIIGPPRSNRAVQSTRTPSASHHQQQQHLTRRQADANAAIKRRRMEHRRLRNQLIERRVTFAAFAERYQMYVVQDVKADCRNSGFEDPKNPWYAFDIDADLKELRDAGEALSEQNSELEPVEEEVETDPDNTGLEFLDDDFIATNFISDELIAGETTDPFPEAADGQTKDEFEETKDGASENSSEASNSTDRSSNESKDVLKVKANDWDAKERAAIQDRKYILRMVPEHLFNVKKLDVNSDQYIKPWEYQAVIREIHRSSLTPALKYFLYRELDRVQCISMRNHGLASLADRIESLEWDIKDFMKKGDSQSAKNLRFVTRDYRAGFIKLPSDGACFLYHQGNLLGYFTPDRLGQFIYPYLERTSGPIWKEDGNQPKSLPDHYGRVFAHLIPPDHMRIEHKPGFCHIHGVQVPNGHYQHQQHYH